MWSGNEVVDGIWRIVVKREKMRRCYVESFEQNFEKILGRDCGREEFEHL